MNMLDRINTPESPEDSFFSDGLLPVLSPELSEPTWRDQLGLTPDVINDLQAKFAVMPILRRTSHQANRVSEKITDEEWKLYSDWATRPKDVAHINEKRFIEIDRATERRGAFTDMMSAVRNLGEDVVGRLTPFMVAGRYKLNGYTYEFVNDSQGGFLAHEEWLPGKERKFDETPRLVVLGKDWIPKTDREYRYAQPVDYAAFLRDLIEDKE